MASLVGAALRVLGVRLSLQTPMGRSLKIEARRLLILAASAVSMWATSCRHMDGATEAGGAAPTFVWRSPEGHSHPLLGRIWDTSAQTFVTEAQLIDRLAGTPNVLLGEIHDNEDHHRLQARVIRRRAQQTPGGSRRLVVEMLTLDQQPIIDTVLQADPNDANALGRAVAWDQSGWPSWSMYRPVFQAALRSRFEIKAANLSRSDAMKISSHALDIDQDLAHRHGLNEPLPGPLEASLVRELIEGHCNMLPQFMIPPMVQIQRLRDAIMADAILGDAEEKAAVSGPSTSVLIAGLGHVRTDRGVPYYLRKANASSMSIGFIEVEEGRTEPDHYAVSAPPIPSTASNDEDETTTRDAQGVNDVGTKQRAPFDFLWFTARRQDRDHCAELRERFKKPGLPPPPLEPPTP
ncbi:MAG: ChaN family lipoprotein [Deltaproteobacteria bacterium]|nr:ChaN family lipoprotein [Deltaproteobacteria bacterium]